MCNGAEKGRPETDLTDQRALPSIYVGESSRSLHERSKEHHADYRKNQEDSHMSKHWSEAHMQGERPSFNQYVFPNTNPTWTDKLERWSKSS